tara:strand:+ start:173 stop:358 length:186 start_codon:yes stop_codon:yes gene_type:complete
MELDKITPFLISKGWHKAIKDNIVVIKAILFFISKFTFNQYTNSGENKLSFINLKKRETVL